MNSRLPTAGGDHPGHLLTRLVRGTRWSWRADQHAATLPLDLDASVMALEGGDRHHRKQGRSTARVRFDAAAPGVRALSVYLKRHYRLPVWDRVRALVHPAGRYSPAAAEWAHLERARALGIRVPEVVAVGERIGPWGHLQSYLMVAELIDQAPLHEAIPALAGSMDPAAFARLKRAIVIEMADMVARLHAAHAFHKDLYLCHFFLPADGGQPGDDGGRLCLIDLHRLAVHRWSSLRWRCKDLGQLLFSTEGVAGVDDRDRLRFWRHYQRRMRLRFPRVEIRLAQGKAALYGKHNRG